MVVSLAFTSVTDVSVGPGAISVPVAAVGTEQHKAGSVERVDALDAARGLAVIGMLFRNVFVFGIPATAYTVPYVWSGDSKFDVLSWAFVELFVDGSMRALFAMLFGMSALFILRKAESDPAQSDSFHWRLIWLMIFGLVHAYLLLSPIDILFVYGVLGLLIFPLRNASARSLLVAAGIGVVFSAALTAAAVLMTFETTETQSGITNPETVQLAGSMQGAGPAGQPEKDGAQQDSAADEVMQSWIDDITERQQGYLYNVLSIAAESFANHSSELFTTHFLDVGVVILIGMALFKMGIATGQRSMRFYVTMLTVCYGVGLTINGLEVNAELDVAAGVGDNADWTVVTYDFGRILMALGHLSLIIIVSRTNSLRFFSDFLQACGRLALTNYVLQTVVCTTLFLGYGFGLYGAYSHSQLLTMAFGIGGVQLVASWIYLRFFSQGPLEWLLRRLIKWRPAAAQ